MGNFAAKRSGAIVQNPEGPNTYDPKFWLYPSGNHEPEGGDAGVVHVLLVHEGHSALEDRHEQVELE